MRITALKVESLERPLPNGTFFAPTRVLAEQYRMATSINVNVQELFAILSSKNPHRGSQAAQLASDLYQLCIESVSDTELGKPPVAVEVQLQSRGSLIRQLLIGAIGFSGITI